MSTIEILTYRPVPDPSSKIVGYVSISVHGLRMYFNDLPVIRRERGFFVASPSRKYINKEEKPKYSPYWGFNERADADFFSGKVIDSLREHWKAHSNHPDKQQATSAPVELPF